MYLDPERIYNL